MRYARWLTVIFLAAVAVFALWRFATPPTQPKATDVAANDSAGGPGAKSARFPQQRVVDGYTLTIQAPQVRAWPEFRQFSSTIAFALTPKGETTPQYGTATVTGDTVVDMDERVVTIHSPRVTDVTFADAVPAAYTAAVTDATTRESLAVPVDIFLAHLANDVLTTRPPVGFNTSPPPIIVRSTATALLFVDGTPVTQPVANTNLELLVNANWPLLHHRDSGQYYLLARKHWLTSSRLDHAWTAATSLPDDFAKLPATDEYGELRSAVLLRDPGGRVPDVVLAYRPSELIVTDGKPALEAIAGTDGLQWVTNTESPLFKLGPGWYFLAAGRWFTTTQLDKGPWKFVSELPGAFAAIPEDHPRAAVRAAVPGTVEAKLAALEALVPRSTTVRTGSAPPVEITYAGNPKFEPIVGTEISRAVNSGLDVFMYQNLFYLCHAGVWYVAQSPLGPWSATAQVPDAFYTIPPNSPAYHVTDVTVTDSTSDEIEYTSTEAYEDGVYVAYGTTWYGTGWYDPPYIYGPIYYPFWGSYGHGCWYNPLTGRYGSRSVWYGPYGGYSYTQGYNPRTGRYGYVETAWDTGDWASFGETYNPRTGIGVRTERTRDFYDNTSTVARETSLGGQSNVQRSRTGGTVSSDRTLTTAGGDTYTMSGEQSLGRGSSTITGADGQITTNTARNDGRSATVIEGTGGGRAVSISGEDYGDRLTVAEGEGGNVYAGYNGNIYKKTSSGWQRLDNGAWKPADSSPYVARERAPPPPKLPPAVAAPSAAAPAVTGARVVTPQTATHADRARAEQRVREEREERERAQVEREQLERDYEARERGDRQFRQRAVQRGGGRRR